MAMSRLQRYIYFRLKVILAPYAWLFQHVRYDLHGQKLPDEPLLFLSNHESNWDPVWLNFIKFKHNIHYLANEELFEANAFMHFLFDKCFEEVKRSENSASVADVMSLVRMKKEGYDIGIYPEGDIGMFGQQINRNLAIAKLVKMLQMPVAIFRVNGAFTRMPRWANKARHSKIVYQLVRIISKEELAQMDLQTLDNLIWTSIDSHEEEYRKQVKIKQRAGRLAEWLETGLFWCPQCGRYETLKSEGDELRCLACGYHVHLNRYCHFESVNGSRVYFETPEAWNRAQVENLRQRIQTLQDGQILLEKKQIPMFKAPYDTKYDYEHGELVDLIIKKEGLSFKDANGKETFFSLDEIFKVYIFHKEIFSIFTKELKFQFNIDKVHWPAYLYVTAVELLKENLSQKQ